MQASRRSLRALVRRAGSDRIVAEFFGVHRSTVSRWRRTGFPKKGTPSRKKLEAYFEVAGARAPSKQFERLLKLGKAHDVRNRKKKRAHREPFRLPDQTSKEYVREKRNTSYLVKTKQIGRILTPVLSTELLFWYKRAIYSVRKPRRYFQLGYLASSHDEGSRGLRLIAGYPPIWVKQLKGEKGSRGFILLYPVATGRYEHPEGALHEIESKLDADLGGPERQVLVRKIFLQNWSFTTPEPKKKKQKRRKTKPSRLKAKKKKQKHAKAKRPKTKPSRLKPKAKPSRPKQRPKAKQRLKTKKRKRTR